MSFQFQILCINSIFFVSCHFCFLTNNSQLPEQYRLLSHTVPPKPKKHKKHKKELREPVPESQGNMRHSASDNYNCFAKDIRHTSYFVIK